MNSSEVITLVEKELAKIDYASVRDRIRKFLVPPYAMDSEWDYGKEGQTYVCWILLEHPESETGIAYCEEGFGPAMPWGLMWIGSPHGYRIGPDSGWYESLLEAFRGSHAWQNPASSS